MLPDADIAVTVFGSAGEQIPDHAVTTDDESVLVVDDSGAVVTYD